MIQRALADIDRVGSRHRGAVPGPFGDLDMKLVSSVLTVLWLAIAVPTPLQAQAPAGPRVAPEPEARLPYKPTGLSLPRPYVRGKIAGRLRAWAMGQAGVMAIDD